MIGSMVYVIENIARMRSDLKSSCDCIGDLGRMGYQLIFCCLPAVLCVALGYSLTKDSTRYIATHVYDADGRYKNFFRTTTFGKQWSLKINTEKYGIDFITFFASDHYRLALCMVFNIDICCH